MGSDLMCIVHKVECRIIMNSLQERKTERQRRKERKTERKRKRKKDRKKNSDRQAERQTDKCYLIARTIGKTE